MQSKLEAVFTPEELATVLAALRFYQGRTHPTEIEDIATNYGEYVALDGTGIDDVCEFLRLYI